MWKKIFIIIFSFVGTFSVVYAMNQSMKGAVVDVTVKKGDIVEFGEYNGKTLKWKVLQVNSNYEATMITNEILDTISISSTTNGAMDAMDAYIIKFKASKLKLSTEEELTIVKDPFFLTKAEVFGGDDAVYDNPNTSIYFANNDERGAVVSSDAHQVAPKQNYWATYTYNAAAANRTVSVSPTGEPYKYSGARAIGIRPAIVVSMRAYYTGKPQNGLSKYEYSKNVSTGDIVGELDGLNDTSSVILSIDTSAPAGHENDYLNFELVSDSATKSFVKIKANGAPAVVNDSLKAGDYYFQYTVNGSFGEYTDKVKITVEKTMPTLSFDDASKKNMKIGDIAFSDTVTTSNTDTTSSDISYTLSGGVTGVLNAKINSVNPFMYDVKIEKTHTGVGLPATFILNASIKETENFNAVSTSINREIYAYKEMSSVTWSPKKTAFDPTEVSTAGTNIGTLQAVHGVGPFSYELVKSNDPKFNNITGADNGSFSITTAPTVSGTVVNVSTTTALLAKTYYLQFKITDTITNQELYTTGIITVSTKGQPALNFKNKTGGNIITQKEIKFDNTTTSLLAEGGASDNANAIEYDYAPDSMQGGVSPTDYATINKVSGLITPIRTGKIKVQAKRPGDGVYDDVVVYMDLTIEPAEQTIAFNDTSGVVSIKEGASKKMDATGTIKSSGLTGVGSIIYSIDNTTIASVDKETGDVTGIKPGTVTLTATMNKSGELGYNPNYDTVSATKSIKIYKGMSVTWNATSPNLKANDNSIGNKVGGVSVSEYASDPGFAISTSNTTQNADANFFKVIDNGTTADLQLANVITATDWVSHGGSFKVQIDVSDSNGTQTIDIIVTLDEANNDAYFTEGGKKITTLTKKYGENGNVFTLTSKTDGMGVTYQAVTDPNGILTVLGTGDVTINKTGTATVEVVAGAGNGYAQKTVTMDVTIEPGDQSIAFKDTTMSNHPFTSGETFIVSAELKETSLNTISTRGITYVSNDTSVCDIDPANGTITMRSTGNCDITASNNNLNWKGVSTNKVINLYDGMGVAFTQTSNLQAEVNTSVNASAGSLSTSGGIGSKFYSISSNTGSANRDAKLFKVTSSGIVSFTKAIMANDLIGSYDAVSQTYKLHVQIDTKDSGTTIVTTDVVVELKGAPLNAKFAINDTNGITEEFGAGKTFPLDLSSNKGGGTPTYQLKNDATMPSDVLQSVDASGLVTILHANDKTFVGNPLKVEAVIPPSNGYDGETIETEVVITQATQPDFAFVTPNIKLGHGASITPTFTGQLSSGTISMTSGNNALATINGNDIKAKTTDGTVTITAVESGDRDYQSAVTTATVTVNSAPSYSLIINVPSATYGDTGLKATATAVGSIGTNPVQTWSSSDSSIADIDGNGDIIIKKAGTVTITCTRRTTGEPSVTATATLVIDPKPITVTIDNTSKYVGEAVPVFHATVPISDLVGSDTVGQPIFSCKDGNALVDANTKVGKYDIIGTYQTGSAPNYDITVTKGELTIKQDASLASWYHLEGTRSNTTLKPNDWHKEDVSIVLDDATESAGTYNELSIDDVIWDDKLLVDTEGNINNDIAFRIKDTKALSTTQSTTMKIDKTKPEVTSITGIAADRNALQELLNALTFGKYFKPELEVSIKADDILPNGVNENSKLKAIHYEAYQLKDDGTLSYVIASGEMKVTDVLNLVDEGMYMVCATAEDNAGNVSDEKCSGIRIHEIGEDSDDDGIPDLNIDTNGDGEPDINITKNPDDKKPWVNIDTDGDGEPDMNIDRDGDRIPYLNTGIISEWTCDLPGDIDDDGIPDYKTSSTLKGLNNIDSDEDKHPDINIDLKLTGLPTLNINTDGTLENAYTNIDGDGDGLADINIDKTGDGIPEDKIMKIPSWVPNHDVKENGKVRYDTMELVYEEKDELEDNGIIIKPGKDNPSFLPNYALKVDDITSTLDEETKHTIITITGEKSEVKQVFDVSLTDGDKVIQPNGSILVKIPVDTSIKNPRVLLRNEAGEFKEVEVVIEDGYFVFETEHLGMVSIIGDKEEVVLPDPIPDDPKEPVETPKDPVVPQQPSSNKDSSVKGTYTNGGVGGVSTGDQTTAFLWIVTSLSSLIVVIVAIGNQKKRRN